VTTLKTRAQIYSVEAAGLLNIISGYGSLTEEQACRFFPGKEKQIKTLLTQMVKQGRIFPGAESGRYVAEAGSDGNGDPETDAAILVLLDFIEKTEYHCAGEYPVKIAFFADGEFYEIIYVPFGDEALINCAMNGAEKEPARRIVIVDDAARIESIKIPNTSAYCTVENGTVTYYRRE
jgi:hypothetical protein